MWIFNTETHCNKRLNPSSPLEQHSMRRKRNEELKCRHFLIDDVIDHSCTRWAIDKGCIPIDCCKRLGATNLWNKSWRNCVFVFIKKWVCHSTYAYATLRQSVAGNLTFGGIVFKFLNRYFVILIYYPSQASATNRVFFKKHQGGRDQLQQKWELMLKHLQHHTISGRGDQREPNTSPTSILHGLLFSTLLLLIIQVQPALCQLRWRNSSIY